MKLCYRSRKPVLEAAGRTIGIDCHAGDSSFVSHAHSDHSSFVAKPKHVIASPETIDLVAARDGSTPRNHGRGLDDGTTRVELIESGHVLGSRQLYAEADGETFVYTGDLNLNGSLTTPRADVRECDTLLMECTYGLREYDFPAREDVHREIQRWVKAGQAKGEITVFGAYTLGKTQELVAILNEAGIAPLVTPPAKRFCEVYEKHGVRQDCIENTSSEAASEFRGAFTAIVPTNRASIQLAAVLQGHYNRNVRIGMATGWALGSQMAGVSRGFALSDHSDFDELVEYAEATGAKTIYCTHGFSSEFSAALRDRGLNAVDFNTLREGQRTLLV